MRITVDEVVCSGHGQCEEFAPDVFSVGAEGIAHVLMDECPEPMRGAVERAVLFCPESAITIID